MAVLTGHDIRVIRRVLTDAGIDCCVHSGSDNDISIDLAWSGGIDTNNGNGVKVSGLDFIWFAIKSIVDDAVISLIDGHEDDNGCCFASVHVRGC